jgi:hypothetical protein
VAGGISGTQTPPWESYPGSKPTRSNRILVKAKPAKRRKARTRKAANQALEPTEHQLHCAVAKYLDCVLRMPTFWTTFPSGGYVLNKVARSHLKQRGLHKGVPDLFIWFVDDKNRHRCIAIELKRPGKYPTKEQWKVHVLFGAVGVPVGICRSITDVARFLHKQGVPTRDLDFAKGTGHESNHPGYQHSRDSVLR